MALKLAGAVSGTPGLEAVAYLPRASRFSTDPKLGNTRYVVERLRQHEVWRQLVEQTDLDSGQGRPRAKGEWMGMAAQFAMSGQVDVQAFTTKLNDDDWELAGFAEPLSYQTAQRRLVELEDHCDAISQATIPLIRAVKQRYPLCGAVVHVDGTPFRTNARLHHCCPDRKACRAIGPSPGAISGQITAKELASLKTAEIEAEEDGVEPERILDVTDDRTGKDQEGRRWRYYRIQGHLYRCRDSDPRTNQPRLAFRCRLGLTPQCRGKILSRGRDQSWLLLTAVPRTHELYHADLLPA